MVDLNMSGSDILGSGILRKKQKKMTVDFVEKVWQFRQLNTF